PGSWTESRCSGTAVCPTCCGPGRRGPSWASAAHRWSDRLPAAPPRAGPRAPAAPVSPAAPWGVHVTVEVEATGAPFEAATDGPASRAMATAMQEAYGVEMSHLGQGGPTPLWHL